MKNSNRLTLRLQIRSFKNILFQFDDLPFKGLLSDGLIKRTKRRTKRGCSKYQGGQPT